MATELSFGTTVGDSAQYIASIDLTVEDLAMMAHLGLNVGVAAYTSSDEADEPGPASAS